MPIRPEQRALYPKDWPAISRRIRERAGQRCEQCRAPNGQQVARAADRYMLEDGQVFHAETGEFLGYERGSEFPALRFTKIVLTVAHLVARLEAERSRDQVRIMQASTPEPRPQQPVVVDPVPNGPMLLPKP